MTEYNDFGYAGYQHMITDIATALENTGEVMDKLELTRQAEQARDASSHIKSHKFSVGIMGEFKRGKSTVINAILGQEIAPADVVPASATLNRIIYGMAPKATIVFKDGHSEVIPVDRIADYVTKITEDSAAMAEKVEQAVVEYPTPFCQNNVEIIDTPGLNDDERMDAISDSVIPSLDAVVLVLSAGSPFSKSEAEFVRTRLMTSDVSRLIVLVNRIDTIYVERDRQRILEEIRRRIVKEILERTAAIHGEDSKAYQDAKKKLDDVKVYPLSAIQALAGRTENKPELVSQSGIEEFETRLRRLLTEERGVLNLTRGASVAAMCLAEGANALNMRRDALRMSTEDFLKNQREAEEKIKVLRDEKIGEMERIRKKGKAIRNDMTMSISEKYDSLEVRLNGYIDSYPIDANRLKTESGKAAFQADFSKALESEIRSALSEYAEQLSVSLQEAMEDEHLQVQKYMGELSDKIGSIGTALISGGKYTTAGIIGVDALSNLVAATCTGALNVAGFGLMGLGGIMEGYKAAGAKGAATGALGGFISSNLAALAMFSVMGSVAFLPFALITGIAGTMGGKALANLIWSKEIDARKAQQIRDGLKKGAAESVQNLRNEKFLENWADKQVAAQIDALTAQVEQDTETMISGTEATLNAIAADIAKADKDREQSMAECDEIEEKMKHINAVIIPIMERVNAASIELEQKGD